MSKTIYPLTVRPVTYTDCDRLSQSMRDAGREELVHYAGACSHCDFDWLVVQAWLASPGLCEADLRYAAHTNRGDRVQLDFLRRHWSTTPGQPAA